MRDRSSSPDELELLSVAGHRRYHRHSAYRLSGAQWLGEIPHHWNAARLKTRLARNEGGVWGEDPTGDGDTVVLRSTEQTVDGNWAIESPASRSLGRTELHGALLKAGDLVITKSSGSERHIGKTTIVDEALERMACCCSNFMQRLRCGSNAIPRFVYYILNSPVGRDQFVYGSNTTTGLANLNGTIIGNLWIAWPPLDEQRSIAAFLDRETGRINDLIAKKRQLIDLLHEKRTTLIVNAVTKGLNPSAPMKPSGIDWMGEVPAHWSVERLRFSLDRIEQGWSPQCENRPADEGEWAVAKVGCVNGNTFDEAEQKALPNDLEPLVEYEIRPGDVLMSRANTRELLGSAAFVEKVRPRLLLCDKLYRIRVDDSTIDPRFLVFAFRSAVSRFQFERDADGASGSMKNIGQDSVKNLWLPLPPVPEQTAVVSFIQREAGKNEDLVNAVTQAIDRLQEYRAALISAAVTGKIDVRGL
jgi:type I restriction enzyme, S subunit